MKKVIILAVLILISQHIFSQAVTEKKLSSHDYAEKSYKQKKTAWIMLGAGGGLLIVGTVIVTVNASNSIVTILDPNYNNNTDPTFGTILIITGAASALGSIPLFVAASRNKSKAASLSFKNETIPQLQKNSLVYNSIPSLSLKISL